MCTLIARKNEITLQIKFDSRKKSVIIKPIYFFAHGKTVNAPIFREKLRAQKHLFEIFTIFFFVETGIYLRIFIH